MRDHIKPEEIKEIVIKIINHKDQRYDTWGDYWIEDDGTVQFRISRFENSYNVMPLLVHEFLEFWRCMAEGIKEPDITDYDLAHLEDDDPGMNLDAPYHKEHLQSMGIERFICMQDGIDFETYYRDPPIGADE